MPLYEFENSITNDVETHLLKISELDEFVAANPHLKQCLSTPAMGDPVRLGIRKTDGGFQDVLKKVKSNHLHNTVITRN